MGGQSLEIFSAKTMFQFLLNIISGGRPFPPCQVFLEVMGCLSWNYRGSDNVVTIKELCELAKYFAPTVLCVIEMQYLKCVD
jgi:hypothetical protein